MSYSMSFDDSLVSSSRKDSKRKWIGLAVCMAAVGIGIGVLIGWFSNNGSEAGVTQDGVCLGPDVPEKIIQDGEPEITGLIFDNINAMNIRANLL